MIGVDISDRSVKVAEVADDGEQPELRCVCWSPLQPQLMERGIIRDVPQLAVELQAALTKCSPHPVSDGPVVASIPEAQSFVRVLEMPAMSEGEVDEAVQWAVRKHIPFDLERMYVDWESLEQRKGGSGRQVLVGAARRDVVDPLLGVLDALRLNVVALELESQAVVRCLLPRDLGELREVRGVLLVDVGATLTDVALYDQGAMRFTINIQWGGDELTKRLMEELDVTAEQALELKTTVGAGAEADRRVAGCLRAGVLDLARKVAGVVSEMAVGLPADQRVRAILLSGGSANLSGIIDIFRSVFPDIPVQLGNPLTNLAPPRRRGVTLSRGDAMHFTTAIGLALRPGV